jgi:ABC-type nickel/cobalt efflux system permease component RcnA
MNRVITNMTNSLEKRVWGAWIAVLILALVFQGGMAAIDDTLGFRLPTYILVTVTSLVYGRAMYLWRTAHPQEHQQHQQHHQHHQHQQHQQSIAPEQAPPTQKEQDSNTGASNNVENPTDPAIGTHQHVDDRTTVTIPTQQQPRQRLYFLDNVKIFLTALVVTHHTECGKFCWVVPHYVFASFFINAL